MLTPLEKLCEIKDEKELMGDLWCHFGKVLVSSVDEGKIYDFLWVLIKSYFLKIVFLNSGHCVTILGLVHTYPDKFENAIIFIRIQRIPRPSVIVSESFLEWRSQRR